VPKSGIDFCDELDEAYRGVGWNGADAQDTWLTRAFNAQNEVCTMPLVGSASLRVCSELRGWRGDNRDPVWLLVFLDMR
jgi:hypothetical protein